VSLFGTDGVRGKANAAINADLALKIGLAAGSHFFERGARIAVIGRDTRRSGSMLGAALASGLASAGIDVVALGVAPTPAVSFAARTGGFDFAAVISASHNPAEDNGIKLLGPDGGKLPVSQEKLIESLLDQPARSPADQIGRIASDDSHIESYIQWLVSRIPSSLDGFRIALDCANGAAACIAPQMFEMLGAQITTIGTQPNGDNINNHCGATNPSAIQQLTVESKSELGIAFDGDADRCIFSDEKGRLINGDKFMAAWAASELKSGRLDPPVVVGTSMSNLGFERALQAIGIQLVRADVGDRNVAFAMRDHQAKIGGEQSGHIIFGGVSPTGDGLLTALEMVRILNETNCRASELQPQLENWPQLLVNLNMPDKTCIQTDEFKTKQTAVAQELRDRGRVMVRESGTQPIVRVMVEANDADLRDACAEQLIAYLSMRHGARIHSKVDLTHALGD